MRVIAEETSERFDVIPAQRPLDSISYWSRPHCLSAARPWVFPGGWPRPLTASPAHRESTGRLAKPQFCRPRLAKIKEIPRRGQRCRPRSQKALTNSRAPTPRRGPLVRFCQSGQGGSPDAGSSNPGAGRGEVLEGPGEPICDMRAGEGR
jgi:hypothetical protein